MINSQKIHGIVPSDVLIRTAIIAGLNDLRNNTFLLDYVFNWYNTDTLTNGTYGDKEKQRAKNWFLTNDIAVSMNYRVDEPKFPMISIALQSSGEDQATLGDVNYDTVEEQPASDFNIKIDPVLGPFTPSYDSVKGVVTLPTGFVTDNVVLNQILYSPNANQGFIITDILSSNQLVIATGLNIDFTNAIVTPIDAFYVVSIESVMFKETYQLKCFAMNDPIYLIYLHSILLFILYRYKEEFMEKRGFDRSIPSSGPLYIHKLPQSDNELVFARDVTLTGYCRQYWPKMISPKMQGTLINGIEIISGTTTPQSFLALAQQQGWGMTGDDDSGNDPDDGIG
jgi:hypothetical protein